jgi:hypothetical protein
MSYPFPPRKSILFLIDPSTGKLYPVSFTITSSNKNALSISLDNDNIGVAKDSTLSGIKAKTDNLTFDENGRLFIGNPPNLDLPFSSVLGFGTQQRRSLSDLYTMLSSVYSKLSTILTLADGSVVSANRLLYMIEQGFAFMASQSFTSVASGSSVNIYLQNGSTTSRTVYLVGAEVVSTGEALVSAYSGITPSGGTTLSAVSLNPGSGILSLATLTYNITFSGGNALLSTIVPPNTKQMVFGGATESYMISQGGDFLISVSNSSSSASDIAIRLIWYEKPTS